MSSDNTIEVLIQANFTQMEEQLEAALSKINVSMDGITEAAQGAASGVDGSMAQVAASMEVAAEESIAASAQMKEAFEGISGSITAAKASIMEFGELLLVGFGLEIAIDKMKEFGETAENLERVGLELGVTAEEASKLDNAAMQVGVSGEGMARALVHLGSSLQDGAEASPKLQAALSDLNISFQQLQEASPEARLQIIADAVQNLGDKTNLGADLAGVFGQRLGPQMALLLEQGSAGLKAYMDRADELGANLSGPQLQAAGEVNTAFHDLSLVFSGLGNELMTGATPAFTELAEELVDLLSPTSDFRTVLEGVGTFLKIAFEDVSLAVIGFHEFYDVIKLVVQVLTTVAVGIGQASAAIAHLDFKGAQQAYKNTMDSIESDYHDFNNSMLAEAKRTDAILSPKKVDNSGAEEQQRQQKEAGEQTAAEQQKAAAALMKDAESSWDNLLMRGGEYHKASLKEEIAYWDNYLDVAKETGNQIAADDVTKKLVELHQKAYTEDIEASRKAAEAKKRDTKEVAQEEMTSLELQRQATVEFSAQRTAIDKQMVESAKQLYGEQSTQYLAMVKQQEADAKALAANVLKINAQASVDAQKEADGEIAIKREQYNSLYASKQISSQQLKDADTKLANDELAIDLKYLNDRRALYATQPAEQQKIDAAIVAAKQKNALDLEKIDQKFLTQSEADWTKYGNKLAGSFQTATNAVLFQGETLKQGMASIFESIAEDGISMIIKWAEKWVEQQLLAYTTGKVTADASSIGSIADAAGVAGANAFASTAAIPLVGPELAPAAGAAAYASTIAYTATIGSAAGGWGEVPSDQIAQLHRKEMVLPADISEGMRGIIAKGQGNGGAGDTHHWNISAVDAKSFSAMLKAGGGAAITKHFVTKNKNTPLGKF